MPVTAVLLVLALLWGAGLQAKELPAGVLAAEVLAGLREDPLHVSPASSITPDRAVVRAALARTPVPTYVAVVAGDQLDPEAGIDGLALELVEGLADPRAVVVVVGDDGQLQALGGQAAGVDAAATLDRVIDARLDLPFGPATLTDALVELTSLVGEQAAAGPGRVAEPDPAGGPASTARTVGLVGLVATVAIGGGGLLYARAQRRLRAQAPWTDEAATGRGWH